MACLHCRQIQQLTYLQDFPAVILNELVFRERGYEFLGEGKRWYDLKRTGRWQTYIPAAGFDLPTQLYADIPDEELDRNDQIE